MTLIPPLAQPVPVQRSAPFFQAAQKLETAFIAEMLRSVGMGRAMQPLSGGGGADHFSTFLIQAQAEKLSAAGGIGLAESLFRAMTKAEGNHDNV